MKVWLRVRVSLLLLAAVTLVSLSPSSCLPLHTLAAATPASSSSRRPAFVRCDTRDARVAIIRWEREISTLATLLSLDVLNENDEAPAGCMVDVVDESLQVFLKKEESAIVEPSVVPGVDLDISQDIRSFRMRNRGQNKKLLVLNFGGLLFYNEYKNNDKVEKFKGAPPDLITKNYEAFKRPYCKEFLDFCFEHFDVAIWTAGDVLVSKLLLPPFF